MEFKVLKQREKKTTIMQNNSCSYCKLVFAFHPNYKDVSYEKDTTFKHGLYHINPSLAAPAKQKRPLLLFYSEWLTYSMQDGSL